MDRCFTVVYLSLKWYLKVLHQSCVSEIRVKRIRVNQGVGVPYIVDFSELADAWVIRDIRGFV